MPDDKTKPAQKPSAKFNFRTFFFFIVIFLVARSCWETQNVSQLPYNEFQQQLHQKNVKEMNISGKNVMGEFKKPIGEHTRFRTTLVDKELADELNKYGVTYTMTPDSGGAGELFMVFLPFLIFAGIWFFIFRKAMGAGKGGLGGGAGFMSIGKSRAKIYVEEKTKVTFKDVAGADEALEELQEVINFLKNSDKIKQLGGKMPKGVLLVGPPGTGKTLIAKAVAGQAGVPFFSTNGAEFVEMFVGVGAARVRDLFAEAKKSAPCIIFIDELDALGKVRHVSPMTGNDEKEQTLNQLLVEMDGFDTKAGVIIIAATNRPEIIDPALLRAGRFDRQVLVDRPDRFGRRDILKIHTRDVKINPEVDLEHIASLTPGFSGADLANLVNEAALIATREDATQINDRHFTEAMERIMAGLMKKNRLLNEFERKVVAYHEMGHALVGHAFGKENVIHKVSIIPRGMGSLGYTIQRPTEDRYLMTKTELENKMSVLMGGRAAEMLIFNHLSTGASDDLAKVSNIAREMITRYGMSSELGYVAYDDSPQTMLNVKEYSARPNYSDDTAKEIDACIKKLVMGAYQRAFNLLRENNSLLEDCAEELLAKETLTADELKPYFDRIMIPRGINQVPPNGSHVQLS